MRKGFKSLAEAASETLLYLSENKDKGLTIEQTQQRIREAREQFLAKYPLLLAVERLGQLDKYVERATRKGAIAAATAYAKTFPKRVGYYLKFRWLERLDGVSKGYSKNSWRYFTRNWQHKISISPMNLYTMVVGEMSAKKA